MNDKLLQLKFEAAVTDEQRRKELKEQEKVNRIEARHRNLYRPRLDPDKPIKRKRRKKKPRPKSNLPDLIYGNDGWSELIPEKTRLYLRIAQLLGPLGAGIEEFERYMPPSYDKGSPKRIMFPIQSVLSDASIRHHFTLKKSYRRIPKRESYRGCDPVYDTMKELIARGFLVPTLWRDPPIFIFARKGEPVIDRHGRVIYDEWHGMSTKIRNPEVWEMDLNTQVTPEFKKFSPGYKPTDDEKEERVYRFLELYAEHGHMVKAAQAVNCSYYQLLLWANEKEHLKAQIAMAEHAVRTHVRSNAQMMAMGGDKQMITLMMRDEMEKNKLAKKRASLENPEVSDETSAAISIAQTAMLQWEIHNQPKTAGVSNELPPQPPEETEDVSGNADQGLSGDHSNDGAASGSDGGPVRAELPREVDLPPLSDQPGF